MSTLSRRTGLVAVVIAGARDERRRVHVLARGGRPDDDAADPERARWNGDDEPEGTTSTTRDDPPRTGTSLIDDDEDPPTGDETEQDYIDALVATFEEDADEVFTRDDVECLANEWVPAIGVEAFQAAGITPADIESGDSGIEDVVLDRSTAEAIVDGIPACDLSLIDLFIDGLGSDVKDDPTKVACVEAAVTEDQIREALIADILGSESRRPRGPRRSVPHLIGA